VLSVNSRCFGQHLAPPILAGALDTEHRQMKRLKPRISVLRLSRKQKVRSGVALSGRGPLIANIANPEYILKMVLQRKSDPALAPILN
jgi:hypothetical protein